MLALSRIWPGRYHELEDSFHNFRFALDDLAHVFTLHLDETRDDDEVLWADRFYRISEWNPERYHRLLAEYNEHVDLVQDLALELTRAANLICDRVRDSIDPSFRVEQGALLLRSGPGMTLGWDTMRPEYRGQERTNRPIPVLTRSWKSA